MESEISVEKHLVKAKELLENAVDGSNHKHYMIGWVKALGWVLGEEVNFDDYRNKNTNIPKSEVKENE